MTDHLDEILKRSRRRRAAEKSRPARRSKDSGLLSGLNRMGAQTSRFFQRQAGGSSSTPSGIPAAPSPGSLLPLLLMAAAVVAAFLLVRRYSSPGAALATGSMPGVPMPTDIRSRQDVVDAFHAIAARSPHVGGSWWTHLRVARVLQRRNPANKAAVAVLTEIYETARYLPSDTPLPPAQIEAARQAVRQCSDA